MNMVDSVKIWYEIYPELFLTELSEYRNCNNCFNPLFINKHWQFI